MVKKLRLSLFPVVLSFLTQPVHARSFKPKEEQFTSLREPLTINELEGFFQRYKGMIRIVMILSLVVTITSFGINLTRLSASSGNDMLRSKAIKGLLYSGIGIVLFGGATVIMGMAFGLFK